MRRFSVHLPLAALAASLALAGRPALADPPPPPAPNTQHPAPDTAPPPFFGPLPVRLREGLTGAVYLTEPEGADVTPPGRTDVSLRADDGNVSYHLFYKDSPNAISEDLEVQAVRLSARRGLGNGWDASVTGVAMARDGGYLDGLINWWHHNVLFGFHDAFREGNGNESVFIRLEQSGRTVLDLPDATASTSLVVLQARKQIARHAESWRRHPLWLAARGGVKIPLRSQADSQYLDNGAVDAFAGLEGAYRAGGRLWLHGNADALYGGTGDVLAFTNGRRFLPQAVVAGEYVLASGTSAVAQVEDAVYPFSLRLPNHPGERRLTTFGLWRAAWPRGRFFVSLSENIFFWKVTSHAPDVMLSAGLQQRL